ncbi:hypothetical protein SISSUDRAFT_1067391 [Sistotremastrum suecicum HHB10207 ss-3]|uniref:Nucleoplasmin-like domain-containing protein n=1 Tax=Sistotremastrum suecicum HHB10207 ss-3 TaxID=1314776 RepID=A0A165X664_9AGAM|nr:hypothetical protein SISSUDRAFT_1067391 [Sistotremastrum suecicum HHB10207 ss-3]
MQPPVATWSLTLEKGQPADFIVPFDLHVTNACLSNSSIKSLDVTSVLMSHEDLSSDNADTGFREVTICWLSPCDRNWSTSLNLVLSKGEKIRFQTTNNGIDLAGYYFQPQRSMAASSVAAAAPPDASSTGRHHSSRKRQRTSETELSNERAHMRQGGEAKAPAVEHRSSVERSASTTQKSYRNFDDGASRHLLWTSVAVRYTSHDLAL